MRLKGKRHVPRFPSFAWRPGQANDGDARITASIVPAEQRMDFLPKHFGARAMIKFEMSVYDWMGSLCPTYRGGFWNYVELSNGGAFMYPAGVDAFEVHGRRQRLHGTVSAEVAGIIATAFALNGMLWRGWDSLNEKYELLLEFIGEHPECDDHPARPRLGDGHADPSLQQVRRPSDGHAPLHHRATPRGDARPPLPTTAARRRAAVAHPLGSPGHHQGRSLSAAASLRASALRRVVRPSQLDDHGLPAVVLSI
jgi:hypothetical protein